jgi:hypothetical protein
MNRKRSEWLVAVTLVCCLGVLGLWQIAAWLSSRGAPPLEITASDFPGFSPALDGWRTEQLPVGVDPLEPNILAYRLSPSDVPTNGSLLVRLVHGYNMRDCMRIKGYTVGLIRDSAKTAAGGAAGRVQCWRVVSGDGHVSVWCTRMLRAYDFAPMDESVTSLAFPRVVTPDDPNWIPRGVTLGDMRHPVRNLRLFLRSKWNSSRCDLLTFLGLKRPAWASDVFLTLVGASLGPSVPAESELATADAVSAGTDLVLDQLLKWHRSTGTQTSRQ